VATAIVGPVFEALLGTVVFVGLMAGLFVPLEAWWSRDGVPASRRALTVGIVLLLVNVAAMEVAGAIVLDGLAALRPVIDDPEPGRLFAVFVAAELCGYAAHRAMHRVPWLWRFHRLHHEPRRVHWIDAWRQHPIDFVLHGVIVGLPGALLGASLSELAAVVLLRKTYTTLLHANVSWRLGWLSPWIATPAWHLRHHSSDPRDYDRNFAGMFPPIDRLLGTYREA